MFKSSDKIIISLVVLTLLFLIYDIFLNSSSPANMPSLDYTLNGEKVTANADNDVTIRIEIDVVDDDDDSKKSTTSTKKNTSTKSSGSSKTTSGKKETTSDRKTSSKDEKDDIKWEEDFIDYGIFSSEIKYPNKENDSVSSDDKSENASSDDKTSSDITSEDKTPSDTSSENTSSDITSEEKTAPVKSERNVTLAEEIENKYGVHVIIAETETDYYLEENETYCSDEEAVYTQLLCLREALLESPTRLSSGYQFVLVGSSDSDAESSMVMYLNTDSCTSVAKIKTEIYSKAKQAIADMLADGSMVYDAEYLNPYDFVYSKNYNPTNDIYIYNKDSDEMSYFLNVKSTYSVTDELFEIYKLTVTNDGELLNLGEYCPLRTKLNVALKALAEFDDNVKKSSLYDVYVNRM